MPEQPASPPEMKIFHGEERPRPKKFPRPRLLKLTSVIIVLILLATGGTLVAASYLSMRVPLVSAGFQRKVDYFVASVPFIPKTTKQIFTKASQDTQNIKTAKQKFAASIKSADKKIAALEVTSQIDETDLDNVKLSARVKGEYTIGEVLKLDFSVVKIENDLYFKADQIPPIPSYNLEAIKGGWYKIDIEKATEDLKADVRSSEEIKEDIERQQEKFFSFFEENGIFKKIERLPDEKVGGRISYHYQLVLDDETLVKIFRRLSPETKVDEREVKDLIEDLKLDFWIDKNSFFIDKFEIFVNFTDQVAKSLAAAGLPISGSLQAALSYELSDLNEPLQIEAPKGATEIDSIYDLYLKIQPPSLSIEQGVLGISTTAEFGSNVLFLERMIHVVTLSPSSI